MLINVSGTWRTVTSAFINVGGVWKSISTALMNVAGIWTNVFSSGSTLTWYFGQPTYVSTNGYIGFDSTAASQYTLVNLSATSARALRLYSGDLIQNALYYAADASTLYIYWIGQRSGGTANEIQYEIQIPSGANYAYVYLVAPTTSTISGYYYNSVAQNLVSSFTTGSKYIIYFDSTSPTTSAFTLKGSSWSAYIPLGTTVTSGTSNDGYTTFSTLAGSEPTPPTSITLSSITTTTANFTWSAPTNIGQSKISSYEYSKDNISWTSVGTATSAAIAGTYASGTNYTFYFRANNALFTATAASTTSSTVAGPAVYTINWNANGGTPNPSPSTQSSAGASVTVPSVTRASYTFNGWFDAASGGNLVIASGTSSYVPTSTRTLHAQWTVTPIIPTVTIAANSGITQTAGTINWTSTNQTSFTTDGTFAASGTTATSVSKTTLTAGTLYTGTITVMSATGHTATAPYSLTTSSPAPTVAAGTWSGTFAVGNTVTYTMGSATNNTVSSNTISIYGSNTVLRGTSSGVTSKNYLIAGSDAGQYLIGYSTVTGPGGGPVTSVSTNSPTIPGPVITQIAASGYNQPGTGLPQIMFSYTSTDATSLSIMLYRSATSATGPWTALSARLTTSTSGFVSVNYSSITGTSNNWYYVDVYGIGAGGSTGPTVTSRVKSAGSTTTTIVYP